MGRGELSDDDYARIVDRLPSLTGLQERILRLDPYSISAAKTLPHESRLPEACASLHIALDILVDAQYGLHECLAHRTWYFERREPPNQRAGEWMGRYYADDAAFRVSTTGAYLVDAVTQMLEASARSLRPFDRKGEPRLSTLIRFIEAERSDFPALEALRTLDALPEWGHCVTYRNQWFHVQPPITEGTGVLFRKERKWRHLGKRKEWILKVRFSDAPEYTTEGVLHFVEKTMQALVAAFLAVTEAYEHILEGHEISGSGNCVEVPIL